MLAEEEKKGDEPDVSFRTDHTRLREEGSNERTEWDTETFEALHVRFVERLTEEGSSRSPFDLNCSVPFGDSAAIAFRSACLTSSVVGHGMLLQYGPGVDLCVTNVILEKTIVSDSEGGKENRRTHPLLQHRRRLEEYPIRTRS